MTDAPERIWTCTHVYGGVAVEYTRADLATPLDDPRVKALVEAAIEVKADCIARADKNGVVPIGRGAWDQLTAALSALEENK